MNRYYQTTGRVTRRSHVVVLFAVAAALTGCNSGGGGTASTTSTATATAIAITKQNSPQVTGAAYQGVSTAASSGSTGSSTLTGAVITGGGGWPNLARFAGQQIAKLASLGYTTGASLVAGGVITPPKITCDTPPGGGSSGTLSESFNDADNSGSLTTGDSVTANFSNCYLAADGTTFNGGFSLTNLTINGTPSVAGTAWNATATFKFSNMTVDMPAGNYSVNGTFTYTGKTQHGVVVSVSMSGSSLTVQKTGGPKLTLAKFKLDGTVDNNALTYSEYGSGQVTDSALSGYVDFSIPSKKPFSGSLEQYPSTGTMTVTGANNSSVVVTAIDSTTVQLQVDANGNGTVDYTLTEPWSKLSP